MRMWYLLTAWMPVSLLVVVSSCSAMPARADLSAEQVLTRCQKAYGSLKTYKGTSSVVTKSDIGGMKLTFNSSARIQFARPGRIRVDGNLMVPMMPQNKFAFVSDGKRTWVTEVTDASKW